MPQFVDTASARSPLDRTARVTVALLLVAWTVDYGDRLLINLALPHIGADFGLDHTRQGLLLSAFFLAYTVFQIPGGLLADRFGAVRVMSVAVLAWSAFTALTGLVESFALLVVVRLLFGAAEGAFPGASMKALSERTEPGHRMTANGWIQSSSALAVLLGPLIAAPLITAWGWRGAFLAMAVLGVFVFLALHRWLPPPRQQVSGRRRGEARKVLASPTMWCFALMFFGYDVIIWGTSSWVPSYLQTERGLSVNTTGLVVVLPAVLGGLAMILGGRLADRFVGRCRVIIVPAMACSALGLAAMAFVDSTVWFVVAFTVATAFASVCFMPIFAVPVRALPLQLTGAGTGMIFFGGQAAGMVTPLLLGVLVDQYSYRIAFLFLVVGAVLAVLMSLYVPQNVDAFQRKVRFTA